LNSKELQALKEVFQRHKTIKAIANRGRDELVEANDRLTEELADLRRTCAALKEQIV
jgi:hypothetical protein